MSGLAQKEQDVNIAAQGGVSHDRITLGWLEERLARMVEDDEVIDPQENLLLYGVDSISVMELTAELAQTGIAVSFAEFAETPTLAAWWALIETRLTA